MKFLVGVALVALGGIAMPAAAQSTATDAKPAGVRMQCKQEAVTGSFTRKARQCRHAIGAPSREAAAAKKPAPAAQPATAVPAAPPAAADVAPAGDAKGL